MQPGVWVSILRLSFICAAHARRAYRYTCTHLLMGANPPSLGDSARIIQYFFIFSSFEQHTGRFAIDFLYKRYEKKGAFYGDVSQGFARSILIFIFGEIYFSKLLIRRPRPDEGGPKMDIPVELWREGKKPLPVPILSELGSEIPV